MTAHSNLDDDSPDVDLWAFGHSEHDTIGLRSIGFWLYMMSDVMIFAGLFVAHGVYTQAFAGSFTAKQVIEPLRELWPTALILISVLAYGLAMVSLKGGAKKSVLGWMLAAFALGLAFLGFEVWSFADLAARGAVPQVSGFLSDYWVIIWAHGAHVFFGLIWMLVMLVQVQIEGFTEHVVARLINLRIFWFFQAVIWLCVYTVVYLLGAIQ